MGIEIAGPVLTGIAAGWFVGYLFKDRILIMAGNIAQGILGALGGGWLADKLNMNEGIGFLGQLLLWAVGALLVLLLSSFSRE